MNREIKFRGIDIGSDKWIIGNLVIDTDGNYQIWDYACHESDSYTYKDVNKESVGQYTGLKDKNGKEIYDGDWLRSAPGYISYVKYDDKQAAFLSIYSHPEDGEELLLCDLGSRIEVIGNLHEKGDNNG